jgi:hypothetical protein
MASSASVITPSARNQGPVALRHNETFCARTDQNEREQIEALVARTGARRSGPEQTGTHSPLSGPRYRGSNPCLPAK